MPTYDQYVDHFRRATEYARSKGLESDLAAGYGTVSAWFFWYSLTVPKIISGKRTAEEQRFLYERWKRGEPGITKPAQCSYHLDGRAFDVSDQGEYYWLFEYWMPYAMPGARNGRTFGDPGHWDLPGTVPAKCAF